jgi:hypothetical protein
MGIWRCCGEYVGFEKVEFSCFGGGRETESDTVSMIGMPRAMRHLGLIRCI